ncbi:hypothetical protein JCM16303_000124 [Sporobolomyces ruberrimus]
MFSVIGSRPPPRRRSRRARPRILSVAALLFGTSAVIGEVRAQNGKTGIVLEDMDTLFSFGDSYTTTGYKPYEGKVKDLEGIGKTTSGGYNWIQFLAYSQPKLANSYYDLAYSGATTNNSIVASNVPCFVDQVNIWRDWFTKPDSEVKWQSNSTLFTVWFGINDVGFATVSNQNSTLQRPFIFATYWNVIDTLYALGARNILLMGVPPTDRTPFVQTTNEVIVSIFKEYIAGYNAGLYDFAMALSKKYPSMNVALFDTQGFFNALLDKPELYGFRDSTNFCNQYTWNTNKPNDSQEICRYPLAEYVWYNSYHPSWPVHRLLASVLGEMLSAPEPEASYVDVTSTMYIPTASQTIDNSMATSQSSPRYPSSLGILLSIFSTVGIGLLLS